MATAATVIVSLNDQQLADLRQLVEAEAGRAYLRGYNIGYIHGRADTYTPALSTRKETP